jgi:hypothetical protein
MGKFLFDKYSILHFISGFIAYSLGVSLVLWILIHMTFEILENTEEGMYFIRNYLVFWPGGKDKADAMINILGDNISAILGWLFGRWIDVIFFNKR